MKHLIRRFCPLLLAFLLGVLAKTAWDHRQQISIFLSTLLSTIKTEHTVPSNLNVPTSTEARANHNS